MRPPEIEGAMFLALCGLNPGDATLDELAERLDWETCRENLTRTLGRLIDRDLVESGIALRRLPDGRKSEAYVYRQTEDGGRAITETLDLYLFIAKRFQPMPDVDGDGRPATISFRPESRRVKRPPRDRHPDVDELASLLRHGPPELEAPVRVILGTSLVPAALCRLTIGDFDKATGIVDVDGQRVRLADPLRQLVNAAIDGRTAGPLFHRPTGSAWTPNALTNEFRKAREEAMLPNDLVLVGRHRNWLGRKKCRQQSPQRS